MGNLVLQGTVAEQWIFTGDNSAYQGNWLVNRGGASASLQFGDGTDMGAGYDYTKLLGSGKGIRGADDARVAFKFGGTDLVTISTALEGNLIAQHAGTGILALTGNNTYTGATQVTGGGTLRLSTATNYGANSIFALSGDSVIDYDPAVATVTLTDIDVRGAGTWGITSNAGQTVDVSFSSDEASTRVGTFVKKGAGAMNIIGANLLTTAGTVKVAEGKLNIGSSSNLIADSKLVLAGGSFDGLTLTEGYELSVDSTIATGTLMGAYTLDGGTMKFSLADGVSTPFFSTEQFSLTGNGGILLMDTAQLLNFNTTFTLLHNATALSSSIIDSLTVSGLSSRMSQSLSVVGNDLILTLSGAGANLTWNTSSNGIWKADYGNDTGEWTGGPGGDNNFYNGDNVTFGDVAGMPAQLTVTIDGQVTSPQITVSNTANEYIFQAAETGGEITGGSKITKTGAGTLTLGMDNSHTGGIDVQGGTLKSTVGWGAFGVGSVTMADGTTFDITQTAARNLSEFTNIDLAANTVNLIKRGAGVLTSDAAHYVKGATTLLGGGLTFTTAVTLNNLSGASGTAMETGANKLTINVTGATPMTYAGTLSAGAGAIEISGGGYFHFTGKRSAAGTAGKITVTGAGTTLDLTGGGSLYSTTNAANDAYVTVSNGGSLIVDKFTGDSADSNFGALFARNLSILIDGGAIKFAGNQTAARAYSLKNNSTIEVVGENDVYVQDAAGNANARTGIAAGTTLTLTGLGRGVLGASSVDANSNFLNYSSTSGIDGANDLRIVKQGAGTWVLAGAYGTQIGGGIKVEEGTLQIGNGAGRGDMGAADAEVLAGASLVFNRSGALTINKVISGGGNVTFKGGGVYTLTGVNTYTGATTVDSGASLTLDFTDKAASTAIFGTSALTLSGGTFAVKGNAETQSVSLAGLTLSSATSSIISLDSSAGGALTLNTGTITTGGNLLISTAGAGSSIYTTTGLGTGYDVTYITFFDGTNYGVAQYNDTTGQISMGGSLNELMATGNDPSKSYQSTIEGRIMTSTETVANLYVNPSATEGTTLTVGAFDLNVTGTVNYAVGNNYTVSGSGKMTTNEFIMSAAKTFTQDINLEIGASDGTLQAGGASTWALNANKTLTLLGSGSHLMGATLTGAGTINMSGTGTLALTHANTFSGSIVLTSGTTSFTNGALGTGKLNFAGGILQWAASNTQDVSANINGSAGTKLVLDTNGNNVTLATAMTVAGDAATRLSVEKTGLGTLSLSQKIVNPIDLVINQGQVSLTGNGGGTGTIKGSVTINDGGKMVLATGDATGYNSGQTVSVWNINKGGILQIDGTPRSPNQTFAYTTINMTGGTITGTASFDAWTSCAINTYASSTTATISIAKVYLRAVDAPFTVERYEEAPVGYSDLIVSSVLENFNGAGSLTKKGAGVMTLTGANIYTGTTTIQEGTLQIGNAGTTGTLGTGAVTVADGATLAFNRTNDYSVGVLIGGQGTIVQNGTAMLALTNAANTFEGTVVVNSGSVRAGNATALGTAEVQVNKGALDLNGLDVGNDITIDQGNLTAAGAKTTGKVNIVQTGIYDVSLGNLDASRLGTIQLAFNAAADTASTLSGLKGNAALTGSLSLGITSDMVASTNTDSSLPAVFTFNTPAASTMTITDLDLNLSDAAATKLLEAAGVSTQYIHLANVATSITGDVNFASPYHIFDYLYVVNPTNNNGWLELGLGNSGRLLVNPTDPPFEITSYTQYGYDKFTGVTNNGTITVTLSGTAPAGGLLIKDLEGSNTAAVINTTGSAANSLITLVDDGNTAHYDGLYQGSIIGNADIVKAGDNAYNLTINGTVATPNLTVQNGTLTIGTLTSTNTTVNSGTTLTLKGSNSTISSTLTLDGDLVLGNNARLTVNTLTGSGPITLNNSVLSVNGAGGLTLDSAIQGAGTLDIQNGALALGTGSFNDTLTLNLGANATFSIDDAHDAANIIGGLSGAGTLNMDGGTLQVKGGTNTFAGSYTRTGTETGTINYSGAGTQTMQGPGADFVNLTQSGSGAMVLANDSAMTYGNVTVSQGTMELKNDLNAASLELGSGSTFYMGNKGTDSAPSTCIVSTGSLILAGGGSIVIDIDSGTLDEGTPFITSTGTVTGPTSGKFTFELNPLGTVTDWTSTQYTIDLVSGPNALDGSFYEIVLSDYFFSLGYDIASYDFSSGIRVVIESAGENRFIKYANSDNTTAAAETLWAARKGATKGSVLSDIITALSSSTITSAQATASLASFAGSSVTSLLGSTRDGLQQQVLGIRNRVAQMGINQDYQYDDMPYFNAWIQANGGTSRLDQDGDKAGYNLDTWGGTVGFDVDVNPQLTLGAAFTANYGDLRTKSYDYATGDNDAYYANLYGRLQIKRWSQMLIVTGGWNDISLKRNVNIAGMDTLTPKGDTNGQTYGAYYETAYDFYLNEDKTAIIQPLFNASLYKTSIDSYTETGAGDASMHVSGLNATYGTVGLGGRVTGILGSNVFGRGALGEFRVQVLQDYGDQTDAAFLAPMGASSSAMRVYGSKVGRTGVQVGAGLAVPLGQQSTIYADVDADFRSRATSVTGQIGIRYNF